MVDEVERKVRWANSAASSFKKAIQTIREDSPRNAEKVRQTILLKVKSLPTNPHQHPPDRFKANNEGNFRAFEEWSYRITYEITELEIFILRFRHVKQEPLEY
ncbi:MAG: type II toxin-antitoxin system RelE/ParE family toxin [Bacteroidia bacterium]|nr:type II toxin-antitoxin system RelE/ParE family toxin [Bacteroidia bacterium]